MTALKEETPTPRTDALTEAWELDTPDNPQPPFNGQSIASSDAVYFIKLARTLERELLAQAREVGKLREALMTLTLHERGIVHLFNSMGEASPAAFSLDCERARALLQKGRQHPMSDFTEHTSPSGGASAALPSSDLEMTRLCAEAMGIPLRDVRTGNDGWLVIADKRELPPYNFYHPLTDDAQAMALVKKFGLSINQQDHDEDIWDAVWFDPADMDNEIESGKQKTLNRAIVECVSRVRNK